MRTAEEIQDDIDTQTKVCGVCGERKDFDQFYNANQKKDGKCPRCMPCELEKQREWRNRDESQKLNRARYRKRSLKLQYGISLEDYDRMFSEQGGKCAICGDEPDSKNGHFSVDHCHTTGKVRGLLCNRCNLSIGKMEDSVELLHKAIEYLEDI